ncbi:hypothetical protein [Mesorhizobium sp.]|uniref:hypothetical protein n=1 Tax=Mesorhizobium sp. TaxID=1871066 RepID=UPI0025E61FD1|nr:hypothetical protein [Mesorhizobium sp.]
MHGSIRSRCRRLAPALGGALALAMVPCQIVLHGCVPGIGAASAHAAKGGNGGGKDSNGNSGSGGNGNGDGANGGNSDGGNSGKGQTDKGQIDRGGTERGTSHVDPKTGDKVDTDGGKITVQHPNGMTEEIENGRFKMLDALGRTIIDRRATPADVSRLKAL